MRAPAVAHPTAAEEDEPASAVRDRVIRACGGASTGVSFLAACGVLAVVLMADRTVNQAPAVAPSPARQTVALAPEVASPAIASPDTASFGTELAGLAGVPAVAETTVEAAPDLTAAEPELAQIAPPALAMPEPLDNDLPIPAAHDEPETFGGGAAPWRLAAMQALGGRVEAHPDPLEGMATLQLASLGPAADPAEAEAGLALSKAARLEVQRRLSLASHDPRGVDGVFGPGTRAAIAAWQEGSGLPATGYLDDRAVAMLTEETRDEYRAWAAGQKKQRARENQFASLEPWPARQARTSGCARTGSGAIAYGQSVKCDFRGLRENVAQVLGGGGAPARGIARRTPGDA